jgi:chromosome segregation ATPase
MSEKLNIPTLEKLNTATKILLVGSILWVGSMVFKRDNALKEALAKIESAQLDIRSAQGDIKIARDSLVSLHKQLENLSSFALETQRTLLKLKEERTAMSSNFDNFLSNSEKLLDSQRKAMNDIKKNQDALLDKINVIQMERGIKSN